MMKNFLKEHSYSAVRLAVTQIAISIFGLVLTMACITASNDSLQYVCGALAILFYLFLLYTTTWDLGNKHHIPVSYGHRPNQPWLGLYIALLANSLNFLFAIGVTLGKFFPVAMEWVGTISQWFCTFTQGMYSGVLAVQIGLYESGDPLYLSHVWYVYFLTPLPAILICTLGYYFGLKNYKLLGLFRAKPTTGADTKDHQENK